MNKEESETFTKSLVVPFEHPVTSLSISPLGREAVLAAKRGLYIINLESPFEPARMLQHVSKWDVADVQWNPHTSKSRWIATTSNQKALVWNIELKGSNVEFSLSKHTRAISDLNWHPFVPELLATCAYDAYVHLWDLRMGADKPANSFCGWTAGATQVKFNKVNEWVLASSHDTDVRIWDIRKGSAPTTLITAHMTKIYGIDWSRVNENELVTCSQDQMVKCWNLLQPRTPRFTIETSSPCWRARYSPFGNAIVTMPHRKDNNLYLWNCESYQTPVYTFEGHTDTPVEFVWRPRFGSLSDSRQYQLVTWSKDMHLRFWPVGKEITRLVTGKGKDDFDAWNLLSDLDPVTSAKAIAGRSQSHSNQSSKEIGEGALVKSFRSDSDLNGGVDYQLEQELDHLVKANPGVTIDKMLLLSRKCTLKLERGGQASGMVVGAQPVSLQVEVTFPKKYPQSPPIFDIQKTPTMSILNRRVLSRKLVQIASNLASQNIPSLDAAVRYLLGTKPEYATSPDGLPNFSDQFGKLSISPEVYNQKPKNEVIGQDDSGPLSEHTSTDDEDFPSTFHVRSASSSALKDGHNVPYPVLCGATFSPTGKLVYFFSPIPHPSSTKFTAYTLTTRNQHPILQTQTFAAQPKAYSLYEKYRSFILAKCPRMFISNVSGMNERFGSMDEGKDKKVDYWLDDEEVEDEDQNLLWAPRTSLMKPESYHTYDFLERLNSAAITQTGIDLRRTTANNGSKIEKLSSKSQLRISGTKGPRRRSVGGFGSLPTTSKFEFEKKNLDDLSIPFIEKSNSNPFSDGLLFDGAIGFNIEQPYRTSILGGSRPGEGLSTSAEKSILAPSLIHGDSDLDLQLIKEVEQTSFGTLVYELQFDELMPISSDLAKEYQIKGHDKLQVLQHNYEIARKHNRPDIACLWKFAEFAFKLQLQPDSEESHDLTFERLERNLYHYLSSIGDFQTLSILIAIFGIGVDHIQNTTSLSVSKRITVMNGSTLYTSSPALSLMPHCIDYKTSDVAPKSKLRQSMYKAFSKPVVPVPAKSVEKDVTKSPKQWSIRNMCIKDSEEHSMNDYETAVYRYSEYLYSLGLYEQRAVLLIAVQAKAAVQDVKLELNCKCSPNRGKQCPMCFPKQSLVCLFCRLPCRGASSFCIKCWHGGHLNCMKQWFQNDLTTTCITGCGCKCFQ